MTHSSAEETYSTEGPECPYCGFTFTPDEPHYFDETGYTEDECPECEKKFQVSVSHSTSWLCVPIGDGELARPTEKSRG